MDMPRSQGETVSIQRDVITNEPHQRLHTVLSEIGEIIYPVTKH